MKLDERILRCVERGLVTIGVSVKQIVYWYIEDGKGLKPRDIPKNPEEFVNTLKEIFGIGASTLEKAIVREMVMEFGIALKGNSFVEAVEEAKKLGKTEGS